MNAGVGSGMLTCMLAANEAVVAAHNDGRDAAVAAQDDGPKAAVAAQDDGPEAAVALPLKKTTSIGILAIAKAIEKYCGVTKADVRKVLDSLAVIGIREVESYGVFTVPKLANFRVHCVKAKPGRFYTKSGKKYYLKARPAGKRVRAFPALALKRSFGGNNFGIARAIEDDVCTDIGQ